MRHSRGPIASLSNGDLVCACFIGAETVRQPDAAHSLMSVGQLNTERQDRLRAGCKKAKASHEHVVFLVCAAIPQSFPTGLSCRLRAVFPPDKPVGVKVSATDWVDGGWDLEQTVAFSRELKKRGADWVTASSAGI